MPALTGYSPNSTVQGGYQSQILPKPLTDAAGNSLAAPSGLDDRIRQAQSHLGRNFIVGLSPADRAYVEAYDARYRHPSGISNVAGGLLAAVGSAVGGPVWTGMTALADYGNNALHPNENSSSDFGPYGAIGTAIGSIYNAAGGAGSYSANQAGGLPSTAAQEAAHGGISESGAMGGAGNALGGSSAAGGNMGWDWGQIINTGATLLGGALQARGARDAANTSAAGSAAAIAEDRRQYDQSRADQMPWLQAGVGALGRLQDPNANYLASPDYAFLRSEGTRDIGNSFSAKGGAQSGNALRALDEFNVGTASRGFGDWWNRQAGLAGIGQTSAQNLGSLGANSAANVGNALQNGANARASGVEGQTNAYTGTIADLLANYNRNRRPVGYGG